MASFFGHALVGDRLGGNVCFGLYCREEYRQSRIKYLLELYLLLGHWRQLLQNRAIDAGLFQLSSSRAERTFRLASQPIRALFTDGMPVAADFCRLASYVIIELVAAWAAEATGRAGEGFRFLIDRLLNYCFGILHPMNNKNGFAKESVCKIIIDKRLIALVHY